MSVTPRSMSRRAGVAAWALLGLIVLAATAVRLRLLDIPLDRDEGEYAYFGQLLLQGIPPYTTAYNLKLPGIYAVYAGMFAARHLSNTMRKRGFISASPPPSLAAMVISLASLEKIRPRLASIAPLKCLTFAHLL